MSFITGGACELLYASTVAGASTSVSSEAQINDTTTMGVQCRLEPDFWLPNNTQIAKAIHVTARGVYSTGSTTSPTLTMRVRAGAAGVTGPILLASSALAVTVSTTSGAWFFEGDIIVSVMGAAGTNSTVQGYGDFFAIANTGVEPARMTGTATTLDTSITNNISVTGQCSVTGCTMILKNLLVYGLN